MGKDSAIAWTDHTWNPWWGCRKIRRACENCYAAAFAKRTGFDVFGTGARRFFGENHWREPLAWEREAKDSGLRRRVFCMSMGDIFETRNDLCEPRRRAFALIRATPHLDWLVLTKRIASADGMIRACGGWPTNARLGITVGTREDASEDIPTLLGLSAAHDCKTFLSIEPQLESIDLEDIVVQEEHGEHHFSALECDVDPADDEGWKGKTVGWVICGAESNGNRLGRHFDPDWARQLRDQCVRNGVPFFYKQGPVSGKLVHLPELDGRVWAEVPS